MECPGKHEISNAMEEELVNQFNPSAQRHMSITSSMEGDFGAWMMVNKPPPRRRTPRNEKQPVDMNRVTHGPSPAKSQAQGHQPNAAGSRFQILNDQAPDTEVEANNNAANLALSPINESISNLDTVDLGKSSHSPPNPVQQNPFTIGKSNQENLGQGIFGGK